MMTHRNGQCSYIFCDKSKVHQLRTLLSEIKYLGIVISKVSKTLIFKIAC